MADPLTDKEAAEAFTKAHGRQHHDGPYLATIHWLEGDPLRCQARTWSVNSFLPSQCDKTGKVALADGSTWCGIHSPAAVDRRQAAKDERRRIERARWEARQRTTGEETRRRAAHPVLVLALREIAAGHNDPRTRALEALALAKEPEE